jgi:hypothetical protein
LSAGDELDGASAVSTALASATACSPIFCRVAVEQRRQRLSMTF